ncbi:cAMP-dependent protein kinase catalytic subunit gamma-like [Galendromus occidentalis]|uniref:non-specific serine/threonine protein kinase n=1 Tax=Galendromus occidentalis TaxID=34638 RepID=A0AAJ6VYQ0_9ACAR|nr:cAMP-dependent protein kinase catalytic subunit gamma-like [Galendromus occidentalis]
MPIFTRGKRADIIVAYQNDLDHAEANFNMRYESNACPKEDIANFALEEMVAEGGFGTVYKARKNGNIYAIKKQPKGNRCVRLIWEKKITYAFKNIFLVELFATWKNDLNTFMIMDYAPYGDLYDIGTIPHPESRLKVLLGQVVLGLEYIHCCNLIHRDLKPDNILVFEKGLLKLCDFGVAVRASSRPTGTAGTLRFMAPEMHGDKPYTCAVDWWALGIMMYELLTEKDANPFYDDSEGLTRKEIIDRVCHRDPEELRNPPTSNPARAMVAQLLFKDPNQRLGFGLGGCQGIKKHVWFSDIDFDDLIVEQDFPEIELTSLIEGEEVDPSDFKNEAPHSPGTDPEGDPFADF